MEPGGGPKIMIVEDDPDLMRFISHVLNAAGFEVLRAYGGVDALRRLEMKVPDLILTDLAMPRMSGVEIIHQVKANPNTRHVPVVAVTAHIWDPIAQAAASVGVDGFIAKPVTAAQLLEEVCKYVPASGRPKASGSSAPVRR